MVGACVVMHDVKCVLCNVCCSTGLEAWRCTSHSGTMVLTGAYVLPVILTKASTPSSKNNVLIMTNSSNELAL